MGAGDGRKRGGRDDGRAGFLGVVDKLFANGAPPEDLGFGDVEFVVVLLTDLLPSVWVCEDFSGDDFLFDEDLQCLGVELDAALSRLAWGGPAESAFFRTFCRKP